MRGLGISFEVSWAKAPTIGAKNNRPNRPAGWSREGGFMQSVLDDREPRISVWALLGTFPSSRGDTLEHPTLRLWKGLGAKRHPRRTRWGAHSNGRSACFEFSRFQCCRLKNSDCAEFDVERKLLDRRRRGESSRRVVPSRRRAVNLFCCFNFVAARGSAHCRVEACAKGGPGGPSGPGPPSFPFWPGSPLSPLGMLVMSSTRP